MIQIDVKKTSITTVQVEAVVNPANSFGYMGGGVASVIKSIGGQSIEDEAMMQAPFQIGQAVITGAGDLVCKSVIHSPTMHNPGEATNSHNVKWAVEAALECAEENGIKSLAIPGMGTGIGGLAKKESAKIIVKTIREFKFNSVEKIVLLDIDEEMVKCFEKAVDGK